MASPAETSVTYEELRDLENEFEDVETEISKSAFLPTCSSSSYLLCCFLVFAYRSSLTCLI